MLVNPPKTEKKYFVTKLMKPLTFNQFSCFFITHVIFIISSTYIFKKIKKNLKNKAQHVFPSLNFLLILDSKKKINLIVRKKKD